MSCATAAVDDNDTPMHPRQLTHAGGQADSVPAIAPAADECFPMHTRTIAPTLMTPSDAPACPQHESQRLSSACAPPSSHAMPPWPIPPAHSASVAAHVMQCAVDAVSHLSSCAMSRKPIPAWCSPSFRQPHKIATAVVASASLCAAMPPWQLTSSGVTDGAPLEPTTAVRESGTLPTRTSVPKQMQ